MPRTTPSAHAAKVYAVISIAVITIIDAGTASSSPFHRTPKAFTFTLESCSRSAGIRVHDALESVTTIGRNTQETLHRTKASNILAPSPTITRE